MVALTAKPKAMFGVGILIKIHRLKTFWAILRDFTNKPKLDRERERFFRRSKQR
jgi:hypothetical protein